MSVDVSSVWDFVAKTWKKPVSVVPMAEDKKMTNTFKFGLNLQLTETGLLTMAPSVCAGGMVGKVIKIELEEDKPVTWTPFMKILVDIDVHKPLFSGYFFDLTSGAKQWLQVKYVKIGIFCYFCGCLGHQRRGCKLSSPVTVAKNDGIPFPIYGPWLSTSSTYHDVFSGPSFGTARQLAFSGVANSGGAVVPLATFSADGGEALKDKHVRVHRRPRRPLSATAHAATASRKAQRGVWFPKRSSAGCVNGTSILSNVDETGFLENEKGPANLSILRENEVDRSFGREGNLNVQAVNLDLVVVGPAIGPKVVDSGSTVLRGELEGDFGSGPKTVGPKSVGNGPNDVGSGLSLKVGHLSLEPNVGRESLVHPNEDIALAQFFKAQEDLMNDLKHFGKLDLYEIRKIGGDIGVPASSEVNERTTPFKKRKFESSASLCSRPHKIHRKYPGVVRDFPWDPRREENDDEIVVDDPSEDSSNSPSQSGVSLRRM
ncbi:hypothetical protein G4B88_030754 [Cannabis sativa]|uniref:Zinc knuckle CX2CX4HX4C domain-containing protein n=1 Tax=Cannabis sativa TaxID=3483 RepID=A0A7J6H8I8_CANSA|nr:hypothetical protein G4B88_030754 [Cannabis sativa]